jgi:hypothetical protein
MRRVSIEISLPGYDGFIGECEESSREYEVLKNGLIFRRKTKDLHLESFVKSNVPLRMQRKFSY